MERLLPYGRRAIPVSLPDRVVPLVADDIDEAPLTDADLGRLLDRPTAGRPFAERFSPGDRVTIVVSDQTRYAGAERYLPLMFARLNDAGVADADVTLLVATGTHRGLTADERRRLVGETIVNRVAVVDHDCRDDARLVGCGISLDGVEIRLNRLLFDADRVVLTGSCGVHYLAGFGGGRKGIMPGVAACDDIRRFHFRSLDPDRPGRHPAIGPASLDGNPMNAIAVAVTERIAPAFLFNTVVGRGGELLAGGSGDPGPAYEAAVAAARRVGVIHIAGNHDVLLASCGGAPKDINWIQAQKAYDNAVRAMAPGGTLYLAAETPDGVGSETFLPWLTCRSWREIDAALRAPGAFAVNGQTAMATLEKSEAYRTVLLSNLDPETVRAMGMEPADDEASFIDAAVGALAAARRPAFFPEAGYLTPVAG
jgi:nickel-dependent lactate racemase